MLILAWGKGRACTYRLRRLRAGFRWGLYAHLNSGCRGRQNLRAAFRLADLTVNWKGLGLIANGSSVHAPGLELTHRAKGF